MKESLTKHPGTGETLRQVALEPSDLAEMEKTLNAHLKWLSVAEDFIPGSIHLKAIVPELYSMQKKIKDLQNYGVPTEIETSGD
jgi:hypothetical protein